MVATFLSYSYTVSACQTLLGAILKNSVQKRNATKRGMYISHFICFQLTWKGRTSLPMAVPSKAFLTSRQPDKEYLPWYIIYLQQTRSAVTGLYTQRLQHNDSAILMIFIDTWRYQMGTWIHMANTVFAMGLWIYYIYVFWQQWMW